MVSVVARVRQDAASIEDGVFNDGAQSVLVGLRNSVIWVVASIGHLGHGRAASALLQVELVE